MYKPILTGLSFLLFSLSGHQATASRFILPVHHVCPLVSPGCFLPVPTWQVTTAVLN